MKDREPNALRCVTCASHRTHVLWRRWRARDGAIVRRHECQDCGTRFPSAEHALSRLVAMTPRIIRRIL